LYDVNEAQSECLFVDVIEGSQDSSPFQFDVTSHFSPEERQKGGMEEYRARVLV